MSALKRFWLLFLRDYNLWLERALQRAQVRAEERRRRALSRLVMLDAPRRRRALPYRKVLRLFWEGM